MRNRQPLKITPSFRSFPMTRFFSLVAVVALVVSVSSQWLAAGEPAGKQKQPLFVGVESYEEVAGKVNQTAIGKQDGLIEEDEPAVDVLYGVGGKEKMPQPTTLEVKMKKPAKGQTVVTLKPTAQKPQFVLRPT